MSITLFDDSPEQEPSTDTSVEPTEKNVDEEVLALRAQIVALTQTGHELVSTQTRMQSLLHNASDGIIQFDADGTVSIFNRAAEKIFGYPEIIMLHQPADHLFKMPPDNDGNLMAFLASYHTKSHNEQFLDPLIGIREDGSERLLQISVAEIEKNDLMLFDDFGETDEQVATEFEAVLCIFHDITERKAIDAELEQYREGLELLVEEQTAEIRQARDDAEAASKAKSTFLASMSHELRTPMHAILSYSDFGLKKYTKAKPEKIHQYFDRIHTAGNRLMIMINDLLDLSKAEAGRMVYNMKEEPLATILSRVLEEYETLIDRKGLTLKTHFPPDDTTVLCDKERVSQIFTNFLSNAIKFTEEGKGLTVNLIKHDCAYKDASLPGWCFSVIDEGRGLPEDELETVFKKFVQSKNNTHKDGGTGLGLAIAKEITVAHGGHIGARNNTNDGAEFFCILPEVIPPEILQSALKPVERRSLDK